MNGTRGMNGPTETTTIEQETTRWLRLNKFSKKIYDLAKEMEDGGYDKLLIQYCNDMTESLMFPVDSKLKDKIQIIMIPRITVSRGDWEGEDELDIVMDGVVFEKVKPNVKEKIEKHLKKNAINFAEDIFEAQKNSDGTYELLSDSGELEKGTSFKMSASFADVPKVGHALVVDIDKLTSGKNEKKEMENLYKTGVSLLKKAEKIYDYKSGKYNLRNFYENIQQRLRTNKVSQGMYKVQQKYEMFYSEGTKEKKFWGLVDRYYASKNIEDLKIIIKGFKELHRQLGPGNMTPVFRKEELEKFIYAVENGGNLSHQQPPVYCTSLIKGKKRNMDLHTYIFPTMKHIRSRD